MFTLDLAEKLKEKSCHPCMTLRSCNQLIISAVNMIDIDSDKSMTEKYHYIALQGIISYNVPHDDLIESLKFCHLREVSVLLKEIIDGETNEHQDL